MAIHQEEIQELQGFKKEIEESALGMIMDNVQKYQYQYPQKSTVRELVSNALDAIRDKDVALSILSGKTNVEDHYIKRDDPMYKDSNFDPAYYDCNWLWTEESTRWNNPTQVPGTVYVTYHDNGDREKGKIVIQDFGVGLGGKRLEGYFKLGYSTKRNTKFALGKYGIGAKAALSTAPYYTMVTRYNGREYSFQVYSHTIASIVPRFDLETGKENKTHQFANGAVIYYRDTGQPNGTIVEVETKQHHKQQYIEAVKSQLLYFDNVEFRIRNMHGGMEVVPTKATILYEDDKIILSDNNQYSKPHLLINRVNYGYIDFRELELEDKMGNIGIKVAAEELEVNPSRESVIWNELTRETVMKRFREVQDLAGHLISEQLKVDDFIGWLKACSEIANRYANSNSIVGRLSKIVDLTGAKVKYTLDPSISYSYKLHNYIDMRVVKLNIKREGSTVKYSINRAHAEMSDLAQGLPVIIMEGNSSFAKDKYLLQDVYTSGFLAIRLRQVRMNLDPDAEVAEDFGYATQAQKDWVEREEMDIEEFIEKARKIEQFIVNSADIVPYDTVVVPENFDGKEEIEEETAEEIKEARMSMAERRKLTGSIPVYTPRVGYDKYIQPSDKGMNKHRLYDWQKVELPVVDIDQWDDQEVFYATDKVLGKDQSGMDILESSLLHLAALLTRPNDDKTWQAADVWTRDPATRVVSTTYGVTSNDQYKCTHFFDSKKTLKLIKVAQDRRKYFGDFKPIQRFFLDIKNKTLTMSNALIRWNTARVMHKHFQTLKFLNNYELFHFQHATDYQNLKKYVETNYRPIDSIANSNNYYGINSQSNDDLVNHCEKVMKFQLFVREHKNNPELIAQVAKEMFNPEQEIADGCAVDIVLYDKLMKLVEYAEPIHTLLNEMRVLTSRNEHNVASPISEQLENEIKAYLTFKGVEIA
jgi:hypothetical protein